MKRITIYRRRAAVLLWLATDADDRLRKAYSRLVEAEQRG